jgi:AcrR family transcriptional regulator
MARVTDRYLEERRGEILAAAKQVFIRKGYDAATMQDIAAEADVAAGSIYRYFDSKANLIAAVTEWCCDEDRQLFVDPVDVASPLLALIQTGERVGSNVATEEHREQGILRLESFLAATRDPDVHVSIRHTIEDTQTKLAALFQAAQDAGEFDASIDAHVLAQTVHAFTAGISTLHVPMGDELDIEQVWRTMVRLFSGLFLVDPATLVEESERATA